MLPSIDAPMTHPPLYRVDFGAGMRLSAEIRARNKQATEEFEAMYEKVSEGLRAWQIALQRSSQFLESFKEVQ